MNDRTNIDRVRESAALADPARVVTLLGLDQGARREGAGLKIRCPLPSHRDSSPSCSVRLGPDGTIAVRCHGCGFGADVLGLYAAVRGLDPRADFPRVLAELAELAGVHLEERGPMPRPSPRTARRGAPRPPAPSAETPERARARRAVVALAAPLLLLGRLDGSPLAADVEAYLDRRGLLEEARSGGLAALPGDDAAGAWLELLRSAAPDELEPSGLARRGGFAWPTHRLVIPWRSPSGAVDTLQRRTLGAELEPRYVFPSGVPPRFPFGIEALSTVTPGAPLAFVEGALDVLAARTLYRRARMDRVALGLPGLAGWRPAFAELGRGRDVFVAFDADAAGDAAAGRVALELERAGARVTRARPTGAKDWAAMVEAGRA